MPNDDGRLVTSALATEALWGLSRLFSNSAGSFAPLTAEAAAKVTRPDKRWLPSGGLSTDPRNARQLFNTVRDNRS
jgi:hypothetical protein